MNVSNAEDVVETGSAGTVLADYKEKLRELQTGLVDSQLRRSRLLITLASFGIVFVVLLCMNFRKRDIPLAFSAIPLIGIPLAWNQYEKSRGISLTLAQQSDFYERGVDRITGMWPGKGVPGLEFARENHLYQWDLDILGEGSLFELLCTTRSEAGAERLASYLLDPVELKEVKNRQLAVKELKNAIYLREEIALLGKYKFQNCNGLLLRDWLNAPIQPVRRSVQVFLLASGPICVTLGLLGFASVFGWSQLALLLIPFAMLQIAITAGKSRWIRPELKKLETLTNEFTVLRQGLDLMRHQCFQSPKLESIVQDVRCHDAALELHKLERLLSMIHHRKSEWVYLPSFSLAVGTQLVMAVERWRTKNRENLKFWLDAWAEFEALNALACYAYEHPTSIFPDFVDGGALLEAKNLGHPLIAEDACVGNDVVLNETARFYLVSGSNMAGKSTFLRAIGINVVLATAGAPVHALGARMSVLAVCASISIADSLLEGKSKFLTEAARLKKTICATRGRLPVLFLIDEILSGTNPRDRRIAAESVVRALLAGGAIGALSTHDLSLADIANIPDFRGMNVHMENANPENPLDFDYRVKDGVARQSNALAIIKMMGLTV